MSHIPTLFNLALDAVADCFEIGFPPTNHVEVSPKVQVKIFETVMRIRDYCYNDHTKALIGMFQPKKLQLNFGKIEEGTFAEIQRLKLAELRIKNFEWISKYRVLKTEQGGSPFPLRYDFRIGRFLDDILGPETKESLRVLDIPGAESFGDNWMEELTSMFPRLEVLNIHGREMCGTDFTSLCSNFPNLRFLDVSGTEIKNLNGLAKLQHLECLNIRFLFFESKKAIKDIFALKQLKHLTFGNFSDFNHNWFFEKPYLKLETLVCHWEEANNAFLKRILPKLPRLQTVVAYDTWIIQAAARPGVSVYTDGTVEDSIKLIGYFRSQGDWEEVDKSFDNFSGLFSVWREMEDEDSTPELITSMVDELEAVIRDFKLARRVLPNSVEGFLTNLPKFFNHESHLNVDKLRVIDMLFMNLGHHLKKRTCPTDNIFNRLCTGINALIKTTEHFNADKVCSFAMKSIIHGGGTHNLEPTCAEMLDTLMDRMDLSSEYYQHINFRKLHAGMRKIQRRTDLRHERRASAGNLLRFVELFM